VLALSGGANRHFLVKTVRQANEHGVNDIALNQLTPVREQVGDAIVPGNFIE